MPKKKKKQVLYPVFFMILVSVVFTTTLAVLNELTIDVIKDQQEINIKKTILYVFDIEVENNKDTINAMYKEYIREEELNGQIVYIAKQEGQDLGYAFEMYGPGLWGSINGYAAVNLDFDQVLGVNFVTHSETPGLGGRIDEEWFKAQFRNIPIESEDIVVYSPAPGGNTDAITGATLTSESVRKIINSKITEFISLQRGNN